MKWQKPPLNKVYEALGALGAIGDGRTKINGNSAIVYSSSGNKYYDVRYSPQTNQISSNDNGSYYQHYLGYPAIAWLLVSGTATYDTNLTEYLAGFAWKDINQKFNNDYSKTSAYIDIAIAKKHSINLGVFHQQLEAILDEIMDLELEMPKLLPKPPKGY